MSIQYPERFALNHKVAVVSGGLGLIGLEISRAFVQAKALTVIVDVDRRKGERICNEFARLYGGSIYFEYFDTTKLNQIEAWVKKIKNKYGSIDVWVNVSYPKTKDWATPLEKMNVRHLEDNVKMHLGSYVWLTRTVALLMKKQKRGGSIINFGSTYGVQANDFTIYEKTKIVSPMPYSAIKGGIVNATRYFASYFGPFNIRVNNVCPGGIYDHQEKRFLKNYERKVPLKRMGTPEDIAGAVLFLASDAASYVTGTTLMVDGGWTIV